MKIAIVGAGIVGSYLYRLLDRDSHEVDLYDRPARTRCGIRPCAWGTCADFKEFADLAGLDPKDYLLAESDYVKIDEVRIPGRLMTFDKSRFVRDLKDTARVKAGRPNERNYDRIIDASGVSRAVLPPIRDDLILPCVQYRIKTERPMDNRIKLTSIGYAWVFPLGGNEYHVGCGSLVADPDKALSLTGWMNGGLKEREIVCKCKSGIRITSPHFSLPFVVDGNGYEIWGVGEAIGCVAPLAGDGIVPGLRSVQLLLKWWTTPSGYKKAIIREFRWMKDERAVVDKLRSREALRLKDAWVLKKNSRRMGMEVRVKEATQLMRNLRRPAQLPTDSPAI